MRVLVMAGTRPEVIKMAPVIRRLRQARGLDTVVCASGQHREMLRQAFADFDLAPDANLDVMTPNQGLGQLSAALFAKFDALLAETNPHWLLVQGDTTSAMIAALCAFYRHINVGHVEAGLRSRDLAAPFPEELNRRVIALAAAAHFAPTARARANLLAEGVDEARILLTGNTVVDAQQEMLAKLGQNPPDLPDALAGALAAPAQKVLVTAHRRENHGEPLRRIFAALRAQAQARPDVIFIYPVHPNPHVSGPAREQLGNCANILLLAPLPYPALLWTMRQADLIVSDSGGIQEEACALQKPILVLRETTERQEGVDAGAARLVGSDPELIARSLAKLLADAGERAKMATAAGNLYGDGKAALRIARFLEGRAAAMRQAPRWRGEACKKSA